jgi:hypothetical protein
MDAETQEEKEYWSQLESTQQQTYPGFVAQVSGQKGLMTEDGRAAVIEFHKGAQPVVKKFRMSRSLQAYLNRSAAANAAVRRRLFVLEGLPKRFIQVLGSRLQVPPSFFAAQWTGPGIYKGSLLNRTPRHYENNNRFVLRSPRLHQAKVNEKKTDEKDPVYYMVSSVHRQISRITVFGDFKGPLLSFEQLSFWSTKEEDSWDGKLLQCPTSYFISWANFSNQRYFS